MMDTTEPPKTIEAAWDRLMMVCDYVTLKGPSNSMRFTAEAFGPDVYGRNSIAIATARTQVDALNQLYEKTRKRKEESGAGVDALYERLAREYGEMEGITAPDRRGGVKGDLFDV